jgi:hypothetical protein
LLTALSFQGGPTFDDAAKLLLRDAVAALLNSVNPNFDFSISKTLVLNDTNAAIRSGNRNEVLLVQEAFSGDNSGAACPLS